MCWSLMLRVVTDSQARLMSRDNSAFHSVPCNQCLQVLCLCACYDVYWCGGELHSVPPYVLIFGTRRGLNTTAALL